MRILVVDDEPAIRKIARRILEFAGHHVLEARSGAEALGLISDDTALDLLVTDVRMPGMTGDQLAHVMRSARPNLKVIYMTASVGTLRESHPALTQGERLVEKPFTAKALLDAVSLV